MEVTIEVNGLRLYAYHGVGPQERQVGNIFDLDIHLTANISDSALIDDDLTGTISYASVVDVARTVMATPAALLEHVAWSLRQAICRQFPSVVAGSIRVAKVTPPLGVELASAAVCLKW